MKSLYHRDGRARDDARSGERRLGGITYEVLAVKGPAAAERAVKKASKAL
jgi:hypothetical protein